MFHQNGPFVKKEQRLSIFLKCIDLGRNKYVVVKVLFPENNVSNVFSLVLKVCFSCFGFSSIPLAIILQHKLPRLMVYIESDMCWEEVQMNYQSITKVSRFLWEQLIYIVLQDGAGKNNKMSIIKIMRKAIPLKKFGSSIYIHKSWIRLTES